MINIRKIILTNTCIIIQTETNYSQIISYFSGFKTFQYKWISSRVNLINSG